MLRRWGLTVVALAVMAVGCRYASPWEPTVRFADGMTEYVGYDLDDDGRVDYVQGLREGRKVRFFHDPDGDGRLTLMADRSPGTTPGGRHLLVVMRGVPQRLVDRLWREGRFRLFYRPGGVLAPLAVRPDVGLRELLTPSASATQPQDAPAWASRIDRHVYGPDYLDPAWAGSGPTLSRVLSFDGAGEVAAENGEAALIEWLEGLERFCEHVTHQSGGEVELTLVSVSGGDLAASRWLDLAVGDMEPQASGADVPAGAAVFETPRPASVAEELRTAEGVDLVAYRQGDVVIVLSAGGRARIRHADGRFAYEPLMGDPLELDRVLLDLRVLGQVDRDGFAPAHRWRDLTAEHRYPDPLRRLWRAVEQAGGVVVSLQPGRHVYNGNAAQSVGGGLRRERSMGFVMSTAFEAPGALPADQVLTYMRAFVKPLPEGPAPIEPTPRPTE